MSTVHRRWNTETSVLFGDYLFSKAFHLAATTGDAEACRLIGLAFQIADDLLDLTETTEKTGKDASNDLSNHRLTLPLIRALKLGSDHEHQRLRDLLTSSDPDDQARLRDEPLVRQGIESADSTAEHFVRRALRNLASLPPCPAREILAAIARFSIHRSA